MKTHAETRFPTRSLRKNRRPAILASSIAALLALGLAPGSLRAQLVINAPQPGTGSVIELINPGSGTAPTFPFQNFTPNFTGPVTVATGDNAIIVAEGKGGGAVQVYNTSFQFEYSFNPFGMSYTGGVNVAIADGALVVGQATGGSQINVYNDINLVSMPPPAPPPNTFSAFSSTFKGGVTVAIGDGHLVVGAASGSNLVNVYDATKLTNPNPTADVFAPFSGTGGVNVAIDSGHFVVGTASGPSQVSVYSDSNLTPGVTPTLLNTLLPYASSYTGGVSVAAGNGLIAIGSSAVPGSQVNVYSAGTLTQQSTYSPFATTFKGGVNVALLPVSATWTGTGGTINGAGDWNGGNNWDVGTAPNSFNANAIFGASPRQAVVVSQNTEVNSITFTANATSAYTITVSPTLALTISGTGITNTSGTTHNFVTAVNGSQVGAIIFRNSATAGTGTTFTNNGTTTTNHLYGGYLQFSDSSSAGSATITNNGGATGDGSGLGGATLFLGTSTAASSIINNQPVAGGVQGGQTEFFGASTAGSATISNNASTTGGLGSATTFLAGSTAGGATINNNAGTSSNASGGTTNFNNAASAGRAHIFNNANVGNSGITNFADNSTASGAEITNAAATANGGASATTNFVVSSNAGGALIFNVGATVTGAAGGSTTFSDNSSAGNAELINDAGTNGGLGGATYFTGNADGGTARSINNGNGVFDISGLTDGGMKIGSIGEGSGTYYLGSKTLTMVGDGFTSTSVTGTIADGGKSGGTGGSLVLSGSTALTLSGTNTYTGVTGIINGSTLNANSALSTSTAVVMDSNAAGVPTGTGYSTLNLGVDQTISALTGAASSTVNLNGHNLSITGNGFTTTFGGVISDGPGAPGSGSLTIGGGGDTLILSGVNTYTGSTEVLGGDVLQVGNGITGNLSASTGVTVDNNATLQINLANGALFSTSVLLNGSTALFVHNGSTTNLISGTINGNGEFAQTGDGPLIVLSANPNFTGTTFVNEAVLQIGTPGFAASLGSSTVLFSGGTLTLVNVATGFFANNVTNSAAGQVGTVNINSANTITLQGTLADGTGHLALTKNGPGTAIISGTSNTYTGTTTVYAGILEVDGTLGNTTVTVNKNAALSGQGTVGGDVFVETGGSLEAGGSTFPGTLTILGNLTLSSGATSIFRLGPSMTSDFINLGGNSLAMGGSYSLVPLAGFGPGTYTVLGFTPPLANYTVNTLSTAVPELPGYTLTVNIINGFEQLVLTLPGGKAEQNWNATPSGAPTGGSGTWNNTATNWSNPINANANTTWGTGIADFGVTGGTVTIPAATTISAQGLIFDVDGYSITGANATTSKLMLSTKAPTITVNTGTATINVPISGTAGLIANGAGTLVLANTANTIGGTVWVVTGTLQLGTASADGSIGSAPVILENGATLSVMNVLNNTLPNNITAGVGQNGTVNFASSNTTIVSGALTDGSPGQLSLNQSGTALTVLINSKNTNSGPTTISAGTLQIGTQTAGSLGPGSLVNFTGNGTLSLVDVSGGVFPNSVTVSAPALASVTTNSKTNLTLSGSLTDGNGSISFLQQGTGTVILSGNNSFNSTEVDSGTVQVGDGTTAWTNISTSGLPVQVNAPSTGTTSLATNLANNAIFSNAVRLNGLKTSFNAIQSSTNTLHGTNTLTGVISGSGAFNQTGTGTTILANAETYTGPTTVSAGTLQIGNGLLGGLASSGVTVSGKGILALDLPTNSTFSTAVNLSATTTDVQAIQPGFLDITGAITGTGGFVQAGPGSTEFDGMTAQFYHGPTNILAGTLEVETSLLNSPVNVMGGTLASFSGGAGIDQNITLSNNGTINFFSLAPSALSGTLTVTGTGGSWTSVATVAGLATVNSGNFNLGPNGAILTAPKGLIVSGGTISSTDNTGTIAGNLTYSSTVKSIFGGIVADQSATTKSSLTMNKPGANGLLIPSADLTLTGPNTYSGPTTVMAGILQIGNGFTGSINSASIVTVNSGADLFLNLYDSADFLNTVVLNGTLLPIQAGTTTLPVPISGSGSFVQSGSGTTILSGNETYTGATIINRGTLEVDGVLPATSSLFVSNSTATLTGSGDIGNANLLGGTINLSQSVTPNGILIGTIHGTLTVTGGGTWAGQGQVIKAVTVSAGNFNLGSGANLTAVGGVNVSGTGMISGTGTLTGKLNYTSSGNSTFGGAIVDIGGTKSSVTINSAKATLILNGTNLYTGPTTVSAGTLQIGDGTSGSISSSSPVTVSGTGVLALDLPNSPSFSNAVLLNATGATLQVIGSGMFVDVTSVITGTGGFTQNGPGSTILAGTQQYTGPTNVNAGTLIITGSTALKSTVTVVPGATLQALGMINGNVISSGSLTETVNIGGTLQLTGGIWDASGTVSGAVKATSGNFAIGHDANLTAPMGLTVSGGTLAGTGTLTGSLNYTSAFGSTFGGVIADGTANSTLTMASTNQVLTLSGMSSYTGATTVNAGVLLVTGTLGDTPVTVNSGAYLAGTGTINGVETIKTGGIFFPGLINVPGTLTVGPLTLNSGANVNYILGPAGTPSLDSLTVVNGSLALGGATLNITKQFGFGSGTYELFSATSAPTGTLKIGTIPTGYTAANFSIQIVGNQVDLVVNTTTTNNAQYWNGMTIIADGTIHGGGGTWDNSTTNWTNSMGLTSAAWAGAAGVFSAGSGTVTVGAAVTATSFGFVPGAGAYTLNVSPTFSLTVTGAGITNTSGTTQNLATLVDGSGNAGSISFNNSANAGNVTITNNGATVSANSGGVTLFNNTSNAGSATIINQGGTTSGASGGVTTFLGSPNAGTAIITNNAGTGGGKDGAVFFVGTPAASMVQIINNGGGDFDMSGVTSAAGLTVGSISGAGVFNLGNKPLTVGGNGMSTTVTGVLKDGGNISTTGSSSLVKVGSGTLILTGTNTYTGATTVNGGTLQLGDGNTTFGLASSGVTVNSGGTLAIDLKNGKTFGTTKVTLNTGSHLIALANAFTSTTISSTISGSGSGDFTLNAPNATVLLTGANTYTGGTTVGFGILVVSNTTGSGTGTGPVAINSGATLGGSGKITGATTLNQGGLIYPGVTSNAVPGATGTTLTGAALTWDPGSKLDLQIDSAGQDKLVLIGALTKGTMGSGAFTVDIVDDGGIPLGTYTLATFASTTFAATDFALELHDTYAGTLSITGGKNLVLNLTAGSGQLPAQSGSSPDADTTSSLSATPTPEPGSAALLALGGAALLGWRRRRNVLSSRHTAGCGAPRRSFPAF